MKRFRLLADSSLRRLLVLALLAAVAPACGRTPVPRPPVVLPFTITTGALPNAQVGTAYSQTLSSVSGTAPITWTILNGSLPGPLTLGAASGAITGTPAGPGPGFFSFTVRATDANGLTANQVLSITVTGGAPSALTVTSVSPLPGGTQNSFYSAGLAASGGTPPYTWTVPPAALPTGLSLNASTGQISGVPTVIGGPTSFTVTVTDSTLPIPATANKLLAITIAAPLTVTTAALPATTATSTTYGQTLTQGGGNAPFTWAIVGGALPTGLTLSGAGLISGTVTGAAGTYGFTAEVSDGAGAKASQALSILVNVVPSITTASLPAWTQNLAGYNQTLTSTGGTGAIAWSITPGTLPAGLLLNAGTGAITGTPTGTGISNFTAVATDSTGVAATKPLSITINAVLVVSPGTLPDWTTSRPYTQTLTASGGTGAHTWATTAGTYPPGVALNPATGVFSGTPTTPGPYSFTITATDSLGATGSQAYTVTINALPTISTTTAPNWTNNFLYTPLPIATTGGTAPFAFATTAGTLPTGLALNPGTGVLSGTPTAPGTYNFTVTATDTAGASDPQAYSVIISPALSVTTASPLLPWTQGKSGYSQSLAATGGTGAQTWTVTGGIYPTGLTAMTTGGVIAGTPSAANTFNFTVTVTDSVGATATKGMTIVVNAALNVTTPSPLQAWTQGKSGYSQTLAASGGTGAQTWAVTGGSYPTGLAPMTAGGLIAGTPSAANTFNFTVTVTDSVGATGSAGMQIVVNPPLNVTTPSPLPPWTQNFAGYSQTLAASGGTGAKTWSLTGGTYPTGMNALTAGGLIAGTPSAANIFNFNVTVTDSVGAVGSAPISITINAPVLVTSGSTLPDGSISVPYNQVLSSSGGTGAVGWASSGVLPTGMSVSAGGVLSGTPTNSGNFSFNVTATDSLGAFNTKGMNLFILAPLSITTATPLPNATVSTAYAGTTLAATGGRVPYTFSLLSGTLPGTITFNGGGVWSGVAPAANGLNNFVVRVTDADGRTNDKAMSIATTGAAAGAVAIVTGAVLPGGTQGGSYSTGLTGSGGTPASYSWSQTAGTMPPGLSISASGVISGTPTTTIGSPFSFTVQLTDGTTTDTKVMSLAINSSLSFTTGSPMPGWTQNGPNSYNQAFSKTGGTSPFTWAITAGNLPTGITLNTSTGVLSGIPTATGLFNFSAQVSDSAGATANSVPLSIQINPVPTVQNTGIPQGTQGTPYPGGAVLGVTNNTGTPPFNWTSVPTPPIAGMTLSGGGTLSGTPTANGAPSVLFTVTDGAGAQASKSLTLTINPAPSITTAVGLPGGSENAAYNQTLTSSGGTAPIGWAMTNGTLPTGMNFSGGTFSGTPALGTAATYNPQITLTDSVGATAVKTFTLVIGSAPVVSSSNPSNSLVPPVPPDTNLVLTFNMAMVKASVESRFSLAPPTAGAIHTYVWDTPPANPNGTILTVVFDTALPFNQITADDLLLDNTNYTWTISAGAQSASALGMAVQTGQFHTYNDTVPPGVVSITPDPTSTVLNNVTALAILFNEDMDTTTGGGGIQINLQGGSDQRNANAGTTTGPMTVQWAGDNRTLNIGFSPALTANTGYMLEFWGARDLAGNSNNNSTRINILTKGSGAAAPFITGTFPPNGAVGVSRDTSIFIAVSESLSPDVTTVPGKLSITGAATPVQVRYEFGKNDGPNGLQITPKQAWPANTLITVSIAGSVTNASLIALPAFSFSFTTGANGASSGAISIDVPFSGIKDAMVDCDIWNAVEGNLIFKDGAGNRVYLDETTLTNATISITDPNGLPSKNFLVNAPNGGGQEVGRDLRIDRRNSNFGGPASALSTATTYTLAFKNTIKSSVGGSFAGVNYTFTTIPTNNTMSRPSVDSGNDTQAKTSSGPPNPSRTLDLRVNVNNNYVSGIASVANHAGATTNYTLSNNGIPGWVIPGSSVSVQGCNLAVNNGTFTVSAVSGGGGPPIVLTLNNGAGSAEVPPNNAFVGSPVTVTASDVTGGTNTFTTPLTYNTGNNNGFQYSSDSASLTNETTITSSGVHTLRYSLADGVGSHSFTVDQTVYFFSAADMSALTPSAANPPGGSTPTYNWSGVAPASANALIVAVLDSTGKNTLFTWVVPPATTSFTQPANNPLPAGTYQWTVGYFHSVTGTIRDNPGMGVVTPTVTFTR
jgi:hypothetical protein